MRLTIHHIDAFTDTVFKGNYAAVILLEQWLPAELMQSIATENNLSETAFAKHCGANHYEIRWFSPMTEIDFCGHATLATAFVLFEKEQAPDELIFSAKAVGDLTVSQADDGTIEMSFPNRQPEVVSEIPEPLRRGLSHEPCQVLLNQQAYFVVYPDESMVRSVKPDLQQLKQLAPYDVVVTAAASQYDFISRYFWPANGGEEDPVTGSIHAGLAPFWAERLGHNKLRAYQASARGGVVHCRVEGDEVVIAGQAVRYLAGQIEV